VIMCIDCVESYYLLPIEILTLLSQIAKLVIDIMWKWCLFFSTESICGNHKVACRRTCGVGVVILKWKPV
jgi:hypothetical protein